MQNSSDEKLSQVRVVFSLSVPCIEDLKGEQVLVIPHEGTWNDFGYQIHYQYIYVIDKKRVLDGVIMLGLLELSSGIRAVVAGAIQESKHDFVRAEDLPQFFSMHRSMQEYRNVVERLGLSKAQSLLTALNDLVALRHYLRTPKWVDVAIENEVFNLAFMRNSESFYAFHNAGSILDGLEEEQLGLISNKLDLRFQLEGFDNEHIIQFRFHQEHVLPKRISVLIGKNGLGKSQALNQLVRAALRNKGVEDNLKDPDIGRPLISRIIAIGTPGETTNTFPGERRTTQKLYYRRLQITRGSRAKTSRGIGELIVQLARSEELIKAQNRWQLFVEIMRSVIPVDQISFPLLKMPNALSRAYIREQAAFVKLETIKEDHGEKSSLEIWGAIHPKAEPVRVCRSAHYPLSSGQLAFFKFALQACLYIENGSLVLLDEPETHLHPNLISDFVDLLDRLLELTGSLAIIATHSAYFVREVPRDQVHVFKSDKNRINISNPRLKTFGADVGAISCFVFEEKNTDSLISKLRKSITSKKINIEREWENLKNELSSEAIMALRRELKDEKE